jgi:hypothetical protein
VIKWKSRRYLLTKVSLQTDRITQQDRIWYCCSCRIDWTAVQFIETDLNTECSSKSVEKLCCHDSYYGGYAFISHFGVISVYCLNEKTTCSCQQLHSSYCILQWQFHKIASCSWHYTTDNWKAGPFTFVDWGVNLQGKEAEMGL